MPSHATCKVTGHATHATPSRWSNCNDVSQALYSHSFDELRGLDVLEGSFWISADTLVVIEVDLENTFTNCLMLYAHRLHVRYDA